MRKLVRALLLLAAFSLTGCASGLDPTPGAPGNVPEPPVTGGVPSGDSESPGNTNAQLVTPRPGMVNNRAIQWEKATVGGDGRHLLVYFWGGIEPCYVLARVDVEYRKKEVAVTLFEGSDPQAQNVACIEMAVYKVVNVPLAEPLGDRATVDGAAPAGS